MEGTDQWVLMYWGYYLRVKGELLSVAKPVALKWVLGIPWVYFYSRVTHSLPASQAKKPPQKAPILCKIWGSRSPRTLHIGNLGPSG